MKVMISYPPIESYKGTPLLSQNRQFQYFNSPTYIYPMIPAYAATLLKSKGYDVMWLDAIAEKMALKEWYAIIRKEKPDVVAIESKAPTIKKYWQTINTAKNLSPKTRFVLMGDHVTAYPEESLENSHVDYVMTGGDFDFNLLSLCNHLSGKGEMPAGVYYWKSGKIHNTGMFTERGDLDSLPLIDRELTKWELYSVHNGNYKYTPGTYTMAGRDCWWRKDGGCTFCSWTTHYKKFRTVSAIRYFEEVKMLVDKYHVKEIFDDTGTLPIGKWLRDFCDMMIESGYNRKVKIGCNMRAGALNQEQYDIMGQAGFRFILYGIESANQKTLDMLNKGTTPEQIYETCRMAKKAGLDPHLTIMVGYPWETYEDAVNTINLAKKIFSNGWADTLQATIVIPYPGTPLYKTCLENDWLLTKDYEEFDMRRSVMKTDYPPEKIYELTQGLYKVFMTPRYAARKVLSIRNIDDLKFFARGVKQLFGHLVDFSGKEAKSSN